MKTLVTVLLTVSAALLVTACGANPDRKGVNARHNDTAVQPDNSAVNARDGNKDTPTAADQTGAPADLEMTRRIRQAVVQDDTLSVGAQNVKIITIAGRVTLRGPVKSDAERTLIAGKANDIAGATNVDNQLEVKQ